jgi:hypothetical protein
VPYSAPGASFQNESGNPLKLVQQHQGHQNSPPQCDSEQLSEAHGPSLPKAFATYAGSCIALYCMVDVAVDYKVAWFRTDQYTGADAKSTGVGKDTKRTGSHSQRCSWSRQGSLEDEIGVNAKGVECKSYRESALGDCRVGLAKVACSIFFCAQGFASSAALHRDVGRVETEF